MAFDVLQSETKILTYRNQRMWAGGQHHIINPIVSIITNIGLITQILGETLAKLPVKSGHYQTANARYNWSISPRNRCGFY